MSDDAARAQRRLAERGWFPSAGSVPFDVARDLIAAAFATPPAAPDAEWVMVPRERAEATPVDDELNRAFIAGWNARLDYSDFDMALHFWMLAGCTILAAPAQALPLDPAWPGDAEYHYGDKATTPRAPYWSGTICGWYRNSEGRLGFNVEADAIALAIHNYPQSGLRALTDHPVGRVAVLGEGASDMGETGEP